MWSDYTDDVVRKVRLFSKEHKSSHMLCFVVLSHGDCKDNIRCYESSINGIDVIKHLEKVSGFQ